MSEVYLRFRGREIREPELTFLRELIAQHPRLSRRALSLKACEHWNWTQPNGHPKDQVCRSLMLRLHRAGHIGTASRWPRALALPPERLRPARAPGHDARGTASPFPPACPAFRLPSGPALWLVSPGLASKTQPRARPLKAMSRADPAPTGRLAARAGDFRGAPAHREQTGASSPMSSL